MRVAVRQPNLALFLQPLGTVGQIAPVQANLRHEGSVRRAIDAADGVVNLVGILQPSGKQSFRGIQAEGAGIVAEAARDAGARALVQVSAIGANRSSKSAYARTKADGEERVSAAYPGSIILRPSIIFGQEDEFFNRFASMSRFAPLMPLIGGGRTRFQPVYVGDVAQAVLAGLDGRARSGAPYELGGPTIYSFRELLDMIALYTQRKRAYLPLPFWLAKLMGALTQWVPGAPITLDQVRLLQTDNVVSERRHRRGAHAGRSRHRAARGRSDRAALSGAFPPERRVFHRSRLIRTQSPRHCVAGIMGYVTRIS